MEPIILDGKTLARSIRQDLKSRVEKILHSTGEIPVLATILVGEDPASETYVKMKGNACRKIGMESIKIHLPQETTTGELIKQIDTLNEDPKVHGILLQHPVPEQIDERECFDRIFLTKDVDGVTTLGFGKMSMGEPVFGSATPAGIMKLLDHYHISIKGKNAVVVGRSPILGKPMAMMLLNRHATVTICHSRTVNLPKVVSGADLVVAAVGKPEFVKADWIRQGAVVIDAGYHPGQVGDVDLKGCINKCSAYTPVPGGVGPMTISTLISQTVTAAEKYYKISG